jgi:RNA polymerase-binding transcription factor
MQKREIEQFRWKLEVNRQDVLQFLNRLGAEARTLEVDSPQDSGDQSINTLSRESLFQQSSQKRDLLRMIEAALRRIREGDFGVCLACGEDIQQRRLEAVPWTQYCLHCQQMLEQEAAESAPVALRVGYAWRQAG